MRNLIFFLLLVLFAFVHVLLVTFLYGVNRTHAKFKRIIIIY